MFPAPDRSDFQPKHAADRADHVDIGYAVGELADGRPFRAELWAQDGVTVLTFFMSTQGIQHSSKQDLYCLLESNNLVEFLDSDNRSLGVGVLADASGNEMFSLNVVIGDEDGLFANSSVLLHKYPEKAEGHEGGSHMP